MPTLLQDSLPSLQALEYALPHTAICGWLYRASTPGTERWPAALAQRGPHPGRWAKCSALRCSAQKAPPSLGAQDETQVVVATCPRQQLTCVSSQISEFQDKHRKRLLAFYREKVSPADWPLQEGLTLGSRQTHHPLVGLTGSDY